MYFAVCILFLIIALLLAFLHHKKPLSRKLIAVESVFCGAGVLLYPALLLLLRQKLRTMDTDITTWAWDTVVVYLQYALPLLGGFFVIFFFAALSPLWEKRYRSPGWYRIRAACLFCASIVVLALAAFFAVMAETDILPLAGYIRWMGVAGVLILRGVCLAETIWHKRFR